MSRRSIQNKAWPEDHGKQDLIAFFTAQNYAPQIGDLYHALLAGWHSLTPESFMAYIDIGRPSIWGSRDSLMAATAP